LNLNIGVIGAGLMAKTHLSSLKRIIEENLLSKYEVKINIKGIADIDEKKLINLKTTNPYNIEIFTTNPEVLINDKDINIIYITTPTKFHKEQYLIAAENGKHIFCEKPLAFTIMDIKEMIAKQKKFGILTQVGLVLRHCPVFWKMKQIIMEKKDDFGKALSFNFRDTQEWPIGTRTHPSEWRNNPSLAHAGCLFEHSIHDVDIIEYLFGDHSKFSHLFAKIRYVSPLTKNRLEDVALLNFQYRDGLIGSLTGIWNNVKKDDRRIEIFFENSYILLTEYVLYGFGFFGGLIKRKKFKYQMNDIVSEYLQENKYPQFNPTTAAYLFENLSFLESIILGKKTYPNLEIGLNAHKIIEAAYQSSKENRIIDFN
jgi:myo-inositol 2-dehydrogenase/D-chiro-inositol 1-dehydrogenase